MGRPTPPHHWYDLFGDMAWWAGAVTAAGIAGGPVLFYAFSCDMLVRATTGVNKKKGFREKPSITSPEICVGAQHKEPNAMYERAPDSIVEKIADSTIISDLGRMMGVDYVHMRCFGSLGSIVLESSGSDNYRKPDSDAA